MDRHQVDGIERFEDGIRLVPGGERVEVVRDAGERRIAPVLEAANDGAQFFQESRGP